MRWHWLRLRATAHPTEDVERVRRAVQHLSGLDDAACAEATEATVMESHHGGSITLVETTLHRARDIRGALAVLVLEPARLVDELDARTDDDGVFYLRFDKQAALGGAVVPTLGEDAVQVRLKPEVHPAGRQRAIDAVRDWLTGAGSSATH